MARRQDLAAPAVDPSGRAGHDRNVLLDQASINLLAISLGLSADRNAVYGRDHTFVTVFFSLFDKQLCVALLWQVELVDVYMKRLIVLFGSLEKDIQVLGFAVDTYFELAVTLWQATQDINKRRCFLKPFALGLVHQAFDRLVD